jgi:hypothetical protein
MARKYAHGIISMRTADKLLKAAKTYLFGESWRNYRLMQAVVNAFYPNFPVAVKSRKCPFCGKEFKTRTATRIHIVRCHREELDSVARDCVEKYVELAKNILTYSSSVNGLNVPVVKLRGMDEKFTGMSQLVDFLIKNPDIIRKAISK